MEPDRPRTQYLSSKDNYFNNTSFNNRKLFNNLSEISDRIIDVTLADNLDKLDKKYIILCGQLGVPCRPEKESLLWGCEGLCDLLA